jgi:hypothetical protein
MFNLKKNEIISFTGKWMELQIMLGEIRDSKPQMLHISSDMQNLDLHECKSRTVWGREPVGGKRVKGGGDGGVCE